MSKGKKPVRGAEQCASWQDGWRAARVEAAQVLESKGVDGLVAWVKRGQP